MLHGKSSVVNMPSMACFINNVTIVIYDSGPYYKCVTIINYTSISLARVVNYYPRVMPQYVYSSSQRYLIFEKEETQLSIKLGNLEKP
jgi:hypothetical protein